ncbi:hypothetical protein LCGC14_0558180 [marine sediment metagenome]|uniref:Yip1 domain-containing protein n=1 Tax=marine sediment metagenome TaxID=412755 RepID=A0A0F9U9A9_9ZZZZ|nr:hypothetical protein [Methylophaga sp.]HEC59601.1 hypothetical protein [Methylophaga sp.]
MNIILRYVDLCRLKAGPADMPASVTLLQATLLAYFLLGISISRIDSAWNISIMASLADTVFMMVAIKLMLSIKGLQTRYQQTLIAIAGAGIVLDLIGLPLLYWLNQIDEPQQGTSVAMLLMIALMFWSLMVVAHIFRQALDIKVGSSAILTIIYTVLSLLVLGLTLSGVA